MPACDGEQSARLRGAVLRAALTPEGLLLGGILDRIFISVLRTLIAVFAYLHTLNLNMQRHQQQPATTPSEQLQYHQRSTDLSRKQAQEYVPEILVDVQRILARAFQLLKVENKFDIGEKELHAGAPIVGQEVHKQLGLGDHDSTVRFLHHSLQLIATVFLFERPGALVMNCVKARILFFC